MKTVDFVTKEEIVEDKPLTGGSVLTRGTSAADIRAEFLEEGAYIVREVLKQARGLDYDMTIDQTIRDNVFEAMLPLINSAGDKVDLGNLASLDATQRANRVLEAVATGVMSPKQATELVGMMKTLADLDGSLVQEADSGKLIINLTQPVIEKVVGEGEPQA